MKFAEYLNYKREESEEGPCLKMAQASETVMRVCSELTEEKHLGVRHSEPCTEMTNKGTQSETGRQTVQRLGRNRKEI